LLVYRNTNSTYMGSRERKEVAGYRGERRATTKGNTIDVHASVTETGKCTEISCFRSKNLTIDPVVRRPGAQAQSRGFQKKKKKKKKKKEEKKKNENPYPRKTGP